MLERKRKNVVSIQSRLAHISELKASVETHPLCFNFYEDAKYFYAILPYPVDGLDGVRSSKAQGQAKALELIYHKLEKLWDIDTNKLFCK